MDKELVIYYLKREMNLTEQGTYKEFLRQLLIFLEDNKNFNNYRESINEFKEELITSNNYRIGDLYTTKWCEREIKVCKYKIQAGAKPNLLYGDPKIIMKKLKEKLKELKETDYEEENNKQLQKYSDLIITKMDKYMCKNISNYEIAKDRIDNDLKGELKIFANIILDYLEEEKKELLEKIKRL